MPEDCNADVQANALFTSLTADAPTPITLDLSDPKFEFVKDTNSDLYSDIDAVSFDDLTEVSLDGEGIFDQLMQTIDLHIQREYKGNRITGDQYAKVYTDVTTAVLGQSVAFLLQRDQAKWSAITAQMQARIAEVQATAALVELEKTKVEARKSVFEMQTAGAQYALTKMQIASTDASYCLIQAQIELVTEQKEAERSKTMDTRSDGSTIIEGMNGKQKDLYDQQIDSFVKDSKQKAAKMYLDGWITQKTLDENLAAPTELEVPSVSSVLAALRTANNL